MINDSQEYIGCEKIKLEQPLFYNNTFGLRFEIGPAELDIWIDFDKGILNKEYFDIALERVISIFESVFAPNDDISIVYQTFSYRRKKIRKGNFVLKQISDIKNRNVRFTKHREIYSEDLYDKRMCLRRVTVTDLKVKDVNSRNILLALINTDFSSIRKPSLHGECYFINHTKGLILLPYDDRGMDVVALKKETLQNLYKSHNKWILARNREQIDRVFS
ncbi:MAG: DUF3885 domain-containing protein [Cyanobacteria bacterium P01_A01_bin.68]